MRLHLVGLILVGAVLAGCQANQVTTPAADGVVVNGKDLPNLPATVALVNVVPGPFVWGQVVPTPNLPTVDWDWTQTDAMLDQAETAKVAVLVTLWPYALWDQANCHSDWPTLFSLHGTQFTAPYVPCDFTAYAIWVQAVVERYSDRVAAWQIMRYPEQHIQPLAYFSGSNQNYLKIVQVSTEAITKTSPHATIVSGTIGQPNADTITFWGPLFEAGIQQQFTALAILAETPAQLASTNSWLERYSITLPQWVMTNTASQAAAFVDAAKVFYTDSHD